MKFLSYGKDGGPESTVSGYWLVEIKPLFSVVLLKFEHGSRDAYHEHAFNSVSWVLKGSLSEIHYGGDIDMHVPSWKPVVTKRSTFHMVWSVGTTWVLSFRGPWSASWREYIPSTDKFVTLKDGRKEISKEESWELFLKDQHRLNSQKKAGVG